MVELKRALPLRQIFLTFNFNFQISTSTLDFPSSHQSLLQPRTSQLRSSVLGETPSFSAARVLFHLHSRIVFSNKAFST